MKQILKNVLKETEERVDVTEISGERYKRGWKKVREDGLKYRWKETSDRTSDKTLKGLK